MLPVQGSQVLSLVRELRSHMPCRAAKKKKKKTHRLKKKVWDNLHLIKPQTSGFYVLNVSPVYVLLSIFPTYSVMSAWHHFMPELLQWPPSWSPPIISHTNPNAELIVSLPSSMPFHSGSLHSE